LQGELIRLAQPEVTFSLFQQGQFQVAFAITKRFSGFLVIFVASGQKVVVDKSGATDSFGDECFLSKRKKIFFIKN
jgi:hypothetical protein